MLSKHVQFNIYGIFPLVFAVALETMVPSNVDAVPVRLVRLYVFFPRQGHRKVFLGTRPREPIRCDPSPCVTALDAQKSQPALSQRRDGGRRSTPVLWTSALCAAKYVTFTFL